MDTTDTTGQHHDAQHIYKKQFVSPFCGCESFIFQHEQTCLRIFRCICKRKKQKPDHCTATIARTLKKTRTPTWTITQCLHQVTKLEATPSVQNCVSKNLIKLRVKSKLILRRTLMNTSGSSTIQQKSFEPQNQEFTFKDWR